MILGGGAALVSVMRAGCGGESGQAEHDERCGYSTGPRAADKTAETPPRTALKAANYAVGVDFPDNNKANNPNYNPNLSEASSQSLKVEMAINLRTASALGLTVPPTPAVVMDSGLPRYARAPE